MTNGWSITKIKMSLLFVRVCCEKYFECLIFLVDYGPFFHCYELIWTVPFSTVSWYTLSCSILHKWDHIWPSSYPFNDSCYYLFTNWMMSSWNTSLSPEKKRVVANCLSLSHTIWNIILKLLYLHLKNCGITKTNSNSEGKMLICSSRIY